MPRDSQLPLPFRPRRFARPRRFTPPTGSWACFIPLPRPGFTLQGMSLAHSRSVFRRLVPSRRWRRRAASVARSATHRRPALRAFIRARVRGHDAGV
jgi:hypothetical protein